MIDVADKPQSLAILRKPDRVAGISIHQLDRDPFVGDDGIVDERQMLRAALDFHPTVCEAFFADHAVLVEGDSETAIFQFGRTVLPLLLGRDYDVDPYTIVSCGGKWTIIPIARLLILFGIPVKIIHDKDAKGRTTAQLAELPGFHPYNANRRIADVAGADNVFVVDDTLEDILFTDPGERDDEDKPYRAWKRMKELVESNTLNTVPRVVEMIRFAYGVPNNGQQGG
jgi:predicted ATP-dependent endonuclease of OLD family